MTRRNKIILAIVIVLVILGLILFFIFRKKDSPVDINEIPTIGIIPGFIDEDSIPPTITKEPKTQSTLTAIAVTFAEKFGSYSNQVNFENFKDLEPLMTNNMKKWTEQYVAQENNRENGSEEFFGVTSRALKADIIALDEAETSAQFIVNMQREETQGSPPRIRVYYQKLLLYIVRDGVNWKIDSAEWK